MKKYLFLLILLPFLALCACEPTDETTAEDQTKVDSNVRVMATDLHPDCWFNEHTLQNEVYHTKPWASKLDSTWNDSYGFRSSFRDLGKGIPKSFNINFWALFPKPGCDTKVVIGIDSLETQVFWAGVELKDSITVANEWKKFSITLTAPANIRPEDRLTIYVWSFDKQLLYVDDLDIRFIY